MSPPTLLLVGAFLLAAIVGPIAALQQLDAARSSQVRLSDAREQLDVLLRLQLAEEVGLRGYVATGQRYFLDADTLRREAQNEFGARAQALHSAVAREGIEGAPALVDDFAGLHATWESKVAAPLLRHPGGSEAVAQQTYGKLLTDQMRSDAATLRDRLAAASDRVDALLRRRINATVALSAGIVSLFAIFAVILAALRTRDLAALAREQALVDALQRTLRVGGATLPRTRMGTAYTSATREALVGGDLIDAWITGSGTGWFLIADASGKGIAAARHSAFAQYAVRALASGEHDPAALLERFNRLFIETFEDPSVFIVLFLGRFDPATGALHYASAGHASAYVRDAQRNVLTLPPTGPIVGIERDQEYASATVFLAEGTTVLLATDGLSEARDARGAFLGEDGIVALLASGPDDPQALCDMFLGEVSRRSAGAIGDDLAILALRVVDLPEAAHEQQHPAGVKTNVLG